MNPIKKLARETAIYGMSSIVGRFLNWWLVPYYSFIFAPETFGIVTNLYSYVAFLLVLLTFGMETGFFRFASKSDEPEKVYSTSLLFVLLNSTLFLIFIVLFKYNISSALSYHGHPEYIIWMAMVLCIDTISAVPFARLRLKNRPIKFAFLKIVNIASNIGFNLFFLSICPYLYENKDFTILRLIYSPEIGVGYVFISNLISSFITLLLLIPELILVRLKFDRVLLFKMIAYSFPILVIGLAGMINQNIDKILIPFLIPEEQNPMFQLGIYGANYKLAVLMNMFIQAFRYAFEPFFFTRGDNEDSKKIYANVMKYFVIFGLFIFISTILYIDVIKLIIDPDYHSGLKVVPIVMAANLFLGISFVNSLWYKLTDRTRFGAYIAITGSFITLILNFSLIPVIGYMGSAIAVFVCFLFTMILTYFLGQKYFPIPYDLRRLAFYLGIALTIYIISVFIRDIEPSIKYTLNTLMLILFVYVVAIKEKRGMLSILSLRKKKKRN